MRGLEPGVHRPLATQRQLVLERRKVNDHAAAASPDLGQQIAVFEAEAREQSRVLVVEIDLLRRVARRQLRDGLDARLDVLLAPADGDRGGDGEEGARARDVGEEVRAWQLDLHVVLALERAQIARLLAEKGADAVPRQHGRVGHALVGLDRLCNRALRTRHRLLAPSHLEDVPVLLVLRRVDRRVRARADPIDLLAVFADEQRHQVGVHHHQRARGRLVLQHRLERLERLVHSLAVAAHNHRLRRGALVRLLLHVD
mmetsp:Transcript_39146/g.86056  ORF Transcript_39146/g.86056 Transcript_39146/m.86056 type:complete len:257 (+) Transcript_39146:414-1184(+)